MTTAPSSTNGGDLRVIDVTKQYESSSGRFTVLDGVNLTVRKGDRIGILGRNGSGKSTLIRIMGGVSRPTTGAVTASMRVSWPLAFGGGFQGGLTGLDNLKFICRIYGVEVSAVRAYVEDFAELGNFFREPLKGYSSGMRARLAFALSMAIDFDCILIDEVIAVGDQRFRNKCTDALWDPKRGRSTVLVSHNDDLIRHYCDRAFVLVKGKLYPFGSADDAIAFYNETLYT